MKSTMSAAARDYVRAFYRDNRLNLAVALALTVLDVPAALIGSWLLGRIIDVIGTGDASALVRLAVFCSAFLAVSLAVSLGRSRSTSRSRSSASPRRACAPLPARTRAATSRCSPTT